MFCEESPATDPFSPNLPFSAEQKESGAGVFCFQTHPSQAILQPDAAGMFPLFCLFVVFVYTSRPPQSKQTGLLISITNLTNKGMQAAKPTDERNEKDSVT